MREMKPWMCDWSTNREERRGEWMKNHSKTRQIENDRKGKNDIVAFLHSHLPPIHLENTDEI